MSTPTSHPQIPDLIVVTGGAGFIGSHAVRALLRAGLRVRVLDNLSSGALDNLPASDARLEFVRGDIRDRQTARDVCNGARAVVHLAALVSVAEAVREPDRAHDINVNGTQFMFEAARAAGVRRFVFASSCALYGDSPVDPQHEALPVRALSPYAATKHASELALQSATEAAFSPVILRFFNVYGPGQRADSPYAAAIPRFVQTAREGLRPTIFGDGLQTRDFVHVHDVARALMLALDVAIPAGTAPVFNVGAGRAISILELWREIAALHARPSDFDRAPARDGEVRHSRACTRRASAILGFTAGVALREGLATLRTPLR